MATARRADPEPARVAFVRAEHEEVVGSDGKHVGTVDKVRGDQIILTRQDQDVHGGHHAIPSGWIRSVDGKVTIGRTADDAHARWRNAERDFAFWNDDDTRQDRTAETAGTTTGR